MPFPVDKRYIEESENDLNVIFPESFKKRMIKVNGGELDNEEIEIELYPFFDKSDKKRISRTCNHIGLETKKSREWNLFPDNAIAIGDDGFGNKLILMHSGDGALQDQILYWFHENGEIEKLANSIQDLEQ